MPALIDDPTSPTIYRTSGAPPFPDANDANPLLPPTIAPRLVTLRDRTTTATIVPFTSASHVPPSLLAYLSSVLAAEIESGDTYPMITPMPTAQFAAYWFQNFGAIMLLGKYESADDVIEGRDWATECLGSFYIKPNYPGRSSHVSNGGFLVAPAARNRGVGRLMGEAYLAWAPELGYTYSVFNLVYETNVASCRIWDALGFKKIGRVPGCGDLKSYPGRLVDAIIYGRELRRGEEEGTDDVSEERFDKIRFYLKTGEYPSGADRAEKSRLRSAATHYKLVKSILADGSGNGEEKLMLKDKEVIADLARQFDIARTMHRDGHGGINKTTTKIAERFHWVRIKETVSVVIRECAECKEAAKPTSSSQKRARKAPSAPASPPSTSIPNVLVQPQPDPDAFQEPPIISLYHGDATAVPGSPDYHSPPSPEASWSSPRHGYSSHHYDYTEPVNRDNSLHRYRNQGQDRGRLSQRTEEYIPLDPHIMDGVESIHRGGYAYAASPDVRFGR
jgi:GNAT superfamily N-acetyltransferase